MEYTPPPPGGQPQPLQPKNRPTSVTILAVLYIIGGVMWIGMGAIFYSMGGFMLTAILPSLGILCLAVPMLIALLYFVIAIGLLKGMGWARILAIIFAIIGLLGFPIGTILSIIILIYLFKDEVKEYFN